jgi:hypothetical protein
MRFASLCGYRARVTLHRWRCLFQHPCAGLLYLAAGRSNADACKACVLVTGRLRYTMVHTILHIAISSPYPCTTCSRSTYCLDMHHLQTHSHLRSGTSRSIFLTPLHPRSEHFDAPGTHSLDDACLACTTMCLLEDMSVHQHLRSFAWNFTAT